MTIRRQPAKKEHSAVPAQLALGISAILKLSAGAAGEPSAKRRPRA